MYNHLKELLSKSSIDSFTRISEEHPFDLFFGRDEKNRPTLLLVSSDEPSKIKSSKIIDVFVGLRSDRNWATSFSLNEDSFEDQFLNFCFDITVSTSNVRNNKSAGKVVSQRYKKWQEMLQKSQNDLLSQNDVKGLVGELIFLYYYLAHNKGLGMAISSWLGPFRADQDFVIENTWYEIKSTNIDSQSVKISSIPQLDSNVEGNLVIVRLEKTSTTDLEKITLNSIIEKILNEANDQEQEEFLNTLSKHGYLFRREYDEYCFRFYKIETFLVNENFPCIRKNNIPNSISNIEYSLLISMIENYKIENIGGKYEFN